MVPVTGEPLVWAFALPVRGTFFLIDIAWGVVLLRNKDGKGGLWWALVAVSWIVALVVDFYHHEVASRVRPPNPCLCCRDEHLSLIRKGAAQCSVWSRVAV